MSSHPTDQPDLPRRPEDSAPTQPFARYNVVLVADPAQDLMHVVRSVMQLTRFPREVATHKMWEAQRGGRSVLLTTYLERAELYAEQFAARGLTVTVEPA